ncbi:TetR/AcrR family transcriptional regulator [Rhodococcus aetherivorans]
MPVARRGNVRGEATRARLLAAALDTFAAQGYHGTGTRDIAEAAGTSQAAMYVHYSTKEELLFQLAVDGHRTVVEIVREAAAGKGTPAEKLGAVVRAHCRYHAQFQKQARVVNFEINALTREHREVISRYRRELESIVRGILTEGVEAGDFRVVDMPMTALALLSLGFDVSRWYREDGIWTIDEIGDRYQEMALRIAGCS